MNKAKILRDALLQAAPNLHEPIRVFYDKRSAKSPGRRYKLWGSGHMTPEQLVEMKKILDQTFPARVEYIKNVKGWRPASIAVFTY